MEKELMWIYGLIDENINVEIVNKINNLNKEIGLSDRFLCFPLHISFKRSFYTDNFENIRKDMKEKLIKEGPFKCNITEAKLIKNMIWLEIDNNEDIISFHRYLDEYLNNKYQIAVDEFDLNYHPHISLFKDDDVDKLNRMFEELVKLSFTYSLTIDRYVIGSRKHENEFF